MRRHLRQKRRREQRRAEKVRRGQPVADGSTHLCYCGKTIFFANTDLCEDCWVDYQLRWHGNDQSAKIN